MNLTVKNSIGEQLTITVIRYFKFNGGNYLIFTKNEIDEAGYQKLYISKVNNMFGNNIDDEIEWNLVRDTIKVIAKANKENTTLPVEDLNEAEVNGIQIVGQKPFKLTVSSVSLLSANKNVKPVTNMAQVVENIESNVRPEHILPVEPIFSQPEVVQQQTVQMPTVEPVIPAAPTPSFEAIETSIVTPNVVAEPAKQPSNIDITNNIVVPANDVVEPVVSNPQFESTTVTNDLFNFSTPTPSVAPVETVDYKKLYEEQTLKFNALTVELDKYKNIVEQLKNILK